MAAISGAHPAPLSSFGRRVRLPILDVYVLKEFIAPFAFAFAAFFLFWAFNIFFLAAKYLIEQNAPFFLVLRFVVLRMPQSIPFAFPFAALTATLLGIGRLSQDNEITAIRTAGVSLWRLCLTPLLFGLTAFLVSYLANEYVAPRAVELSTRTFYQIVYHTASLPVEPQFFRKDPDTGNVFFVSQVLPDGRTMSGVQVFKPGRNGSFWNETLQAKTAFVRGSTLVLQNVVTTYYNAAGQEVTQAQSPETDVGLPLGESAAQFTSSINSDPWSMSSKNLKNQVLILRSQGVGGEALGNLEVNLANKTSFPFASFVAVLIALPLAIRFGRKGRMLGIALSLMAFFVYYLLNDAASVFGSTGRLNPYLASWLPNLVFGLAGLGMLWQDEH